MTRQLLPLALLFGCGAAVAAGETNGYRELVDVSINVDSVSFVLDQECPNGASGWRLDAKYIDIDKGYPLLLAALNSGRQIYVIYEDDPAAKEQCMVKRISVR